MVEPEDEMQLQSPLAILLLHKFAWGRLAASEVQQYADTAVKSGATGADLLTLQKLGGHGSSKNNCHRDLVRAFFKKYGGTTASGDRNLGEGEELFWCCTRRKQKSASHFTT